MTGPYEFREMMRDHEDTKREYRELAVENEALRAQLAESEAACAGYRAALEKIAKGATTPKDASPDFFAAACLAAGASYVQTARQALQSNPGKAVGDVIAAARTGDRALNRSWQELKAAMRQAGREGVMSNPIDIMGRCVVCGKKCESSAGCDCTTINAYGAGSPTTMLAPDAQALIAAKDAEIAELKRELEKAKGDHHKTIQDAATFRALAEKHIESLESKCAKMRELLGECRDELDDRYDGAPDSVTRWAGHLVAKIDAILQRWEGGE